MSAFNIDSYDLIERSFKFPKGVGQMVKIPVGFFLSIISKYSSEVILFEQKYLIIFV